MLAKKVKWKQVSDYGPIAQSVERQTNNLEVMGSIPIGTTFLALFLFDIEFHKEIEVLCFYQQNRLRDNIFKH